MSRDWHRERETQQQRDNMQRNMLAMQGPRTHATHTDHRGNPIPLTGAALEAARREHEAAVAPRDTPLERALADLLAFEVHPYRFIHHLPRDQEIGGRLIPSLSEAQKAIIRTQLQQAVERERAREAEPARAAGAAAAQAQAHQALLQQNEQRRIETERLRAAIPAPIGREARAPRYLGDVYNTNLQDAQENLRNLINEKERSIATLRLQNFQGGPTPENNRAIARDEVDLSGYRKMLDELPTILPNLSTMFNGMDEAAAYEAQQRILGPSALRYLQEDAVRRGFSPEFSSTYSQLFSNMVANQQREIAREARVRDGIPEPEPAPRARDSFRDLLTRRAAPNAAAFPAAPPVYVTEPAASAAPAAARAAAAAPAQADGIRRLPIEAARTPEGIAYVRNAIARGLLQGQTMAQIENELGFPVVNNRREYWANLVQNNPAELARLAAEVVPYPEAAVAAGAARPAAQAARAAAPTAQAQAFNQRLAEEAGTRQAELPQGVDMARERFQEDLPQAQFGDRFQRQIPEHIRQLYAINPMAAMAQYPTEALILQQRDHAPNARAPQLIRPAPERAYAEASLTPQHLMGGVPITADNVSIAGTSPWLGGPSGMLFQYLHKQFLDSTKPYEPYPGETIANLSAPQMQAYEMLSDLAHDTTGKQAAHEHALDSGIRFSDSPFYDTQVDPYVRGGAGSIDLEEAKRLNPFSDEYLDALAQRKRDKFERDVLPKLQAKLVGSRAINTGARSHFISKALAENERELREEMEDLRVKGLTMGMAEASKGRERQLQAAHHATVGKLGERTQASEAARLRIAGNKERNLHQQLSAALLSEEGKIHQKEAQRKLDAAKEEHMRARLHPIEQQQRLGEALRGLPSSTSVAYDTTRPRREEYTSPATSAGALLGTLAGLSNQQAPARHQRGGRVKKAMGGILDIPEKIDYMNSMNQRVGQLEGNRASPFWSGYTNLMANIGASKRKSLAGAVGESLPSMVQGWQGAVQQNEQDADKALAIRSAYIDSLEQQEARKQKLKQGQEALEIQRQNMNIHAGSAASLNRLHDLQGQKLLKEMEGGVSGAKLEELRHKMLSNMKLEKELNKTSAQKGLEEAEGKEIDDILEAGRTSEKLKDTYGNLARLAPKLGFAEVGGAKVPRLISEATDWMTGGDEATRTAYRALNAEALAEITKILKGNQSDKDMMIWELTAPNISNDEKGIIKVYKAKEAMAERSAQYSQYISNAVQQGKSLNQAKQKWKQYTSEYPLFDDKLNVVEDPARKAATELLIRGEL